MVTSICQIRLGVGKRQAPGREEVGFGLGGHWPPKPVSLTTVPHTQPCCGLI